MYRVKYILKRIINILLFFILLPFLVLIVVFGSIISVLTIPVEYPKYKKSKYYKDRKDKYHLGLTKELHYKIYNYIKIKNLKIDFLENNKIYYLRKNNINYLISNYKLLRDIEVDNNKIKISQDLEEHIEIDEFIKRINKKLNLKGQTKIIIEKNKKRELIKNIKCDKIIIIDKIEEIERL